MTDAELKAKCQEIEINAFRLSLLFAQGKLDFKASGHPSAAAAITSTILDAAKCKEQLIRAWEAKNPL